MQNEIIKKMLQDGYNNVAFTDKYILGWTLDHVVYMAICDREIVNRVTCLDRASQGAGFSLRFKPNKRQKMLLMTYKAEAICSEKFFNEIVAESKYNKGEIFEKLVTEKFGLIWEKDNAAHEVGAGVFNGELGTIERIDEEERQIQIRFDDDKVALYQYADLDQIEHSYSITIHKAQRK